jgi:adenine-specific DNA-methyltransferase
MLPYPRKQKVFALRLRREQTDAEKKLWSKLRDRRLCGVKFRRQHPIGPFVADFCCVEMRLIVELDGSQHMMQVESDRKRTRYLAQKGFRMLRFSNHHVLTQIDAVLERILEVLQSSTVDEGGTKDDLSVADERSWLKKSI